MPRPDLVKLRCSTIAGHLVVDVFDPADGSIITSDTIAAIGEWLAALGYRWVTGSRALWIREA